eukprot:gnl/MRDRNA2_/MRDRNA2_35251_c0_seq1.p1 gnl/MRDRNA2_/MRDRNA2_35251_c0~~gnl/MRDRNA2_/MRDRNA2_35251_c0_seq1.p1  ORF type:complete len:474 (-),score=104.38 gnl/MRDRNA2_/MRDRNA2_35251_c0_seq1:166-1587(-)
MQMGALLAQLRASGCTTKACIVIEALLGSLQVEFNDLKACEADFDKEWINIQNFTEDLKEKKWKDAFLVLGNLLNNVGQGVSTCGIPQVGKILAGAATSLHEDAVANVINEAVAVLVSGADITPDLDKIIVDSENKDWASLGKDLGVLSDWIKSDTHCNSIVCKVIEGLLQEADMALTNLKPCEAKLRLAETEFVGCAQNFAQGKPGAGLQYCSAALNYVAQSVSDCGIAKELEYIVQEANVLGLGNLTIVDEAAKILVHGADFYETLYAAVQDMEKHDWRDAGAGLAKVMNELSQWTTGHLCTSPVCYVVNGVMQYLADIKNDFKKCKNDFPQTWGNFSAAWKDITAGDTKNGHFHFNANHTLIKKGVNEFGLAFKDMSNIVGDCHLQDLADILEHLAVKLGLAPEVTYIEDVIKILIEGVSIEREISDACNDWEEQNWPSFGYNLIKIIKQLLTAEDLKTYQKSLPQPIYV